MVRPQHFLPVHGEAAFLYAHAELARSAGVAHTSVIHNGQMLGVGERRSRTHVSSGSLAGVDAKVCRSELPRMGCPTQSGQGNCRPLCLAVAFRKVGNAARLSGL